MVVFLSLLFLKRYIFLLKTSRLMTTPNRATLTLAPNVPTSKTTPCCCCCCLCCSCFFFYDLKDWTYDPVNFAQSSVNSFIDDVHSGGQKFVVIVDPGVLALDNSWTCSNPDQGDAGDIGCPYDPYSQGIEQNVFVRDGFSAGEGGDGQGSPYMAQVIVVVTWHR